MQHHQLCYSLGIQRQGLLCCRKRIRKPGSENTQCPPSRRRKVGTEEGEEEGGRSTGGISCQIFSTFSPNACWSGKFSKRLCSPARACWSPWAKALWDANASVILPCLFPGLKDGPPVPSFSPSETLLPNGGRRGSKAEPWSGRMFTKSPATAVHQGGWPKQPGKAVRGAGRGRRMGLPAVAAARSTLGSMGSHEQED